ncbi:MAG: glutaredoxin family protein [Polyangiaceae bacterium]
MPRLDFYTRKDCHLCDEALAELARIRKDHPFELSIIDLDTEAPADKRQAYDWEVPVVELDGRKIMKYRIDEARLLRLLDGPP